MTSLQELIYLCRDAVKVALLYELALNDLQGAIAGLHSTCSLALTVSQVHAQLGRQIRLGANMTSRPNHLGNPF